MTAIYGIFSPCGLCLYVGQSINAPVRFASHRSDRFRDIPCSFRVLRSCAPSEANRLEVQIMLAYRRRGQALMNRVLKAFGRPPINPELRANKYIILRITAAEKAAYKQAAQRAGLTLTAWICSVCDAASGFTEPPK